MRAFDNLYEEPAFEVTSREHSIAAVVAGAAAVAVASTVAAIQYSGAPTWFSAAYVRIYRLLIRLASDAFASPPIAARPPSIRPSVVLVFRARACRLASSH